LPAASCSVRSSRRAIDDRRAGGAIGAETIRAG
jgi:hypothetical protein